jgi:cell division protein FtsI/penicillin-binding protein 2
MNENKETNDTIDDQHNPWPGIHLEYRQEQDQRSEPSKGFAYITTVGWIDRRERTRRKDDPFDY